MRKMDLRTVDGDIKALHVGGEYSGLNFTKRDVNAMVDDLMATSSLPGGKPRSRGDLMAELVTRTLARCGEGHPLPGGPLTPEELREAIRLVEKSCRKGWF